MINIVIGKPGSGKTYHMVKYLYEVLTELLKKSDIERKIYTNISVNIDEFNKQLSKDFNMEIDVTSILKTLSPEDLKYDSRRVALEDRIEKRVAGKSFYSVAATSKAFFWNRFDDNALIIIDEIQKYLSTVKEESESEKQSLIEYFSLHRHKRHDWYFITQNLLSLPVEIRRVSEKVYNIFNAKSMSIGFPINIPMRDIETLLAGFNITRQLYRVREGYLENTYRVTYEDSVEVVVMEKRVFALYQTHTQLKESSSAAIFRGDSTLPFDLGPGQRRRAVMWFLKKHGFHLSVKLLIVGWFLGGVLSFFHVFSPRKSEASQKIEKKEETSDVFLKETSDDNIVETELIIPAKPPSILIYNRVALIDGVEYRLGEIYNDKRIVGISARKGIEYEDPILLYYRDNVFLSDCVRLQERFFKQERPE